MKIGVNARFLTKPYTGIGQYTSFLFTELAKIDKGREYLLMVQEPCNFEGTCILREAGLLLPGLKKTYWEQFSVPQFLKKEKVSLVHFPYPCNTWYSYKIPTVVTVHDTIPFDFPEYRPNFLSKLYHHMVKKSLKNATKIITVSEASKRDIMRHTHVKEDKIAVIYNAASPVFSHMVSPEKRALILRKYGLTKPYFIYVGGYDGRKNVSLLSEIFNKYISPKYDVDLVLIGGKLFNSPLYGSFDSLTENTLSTTIAPERKRGGVKRLSFISNEELAALYQGSLCFLHLSKKEGFNIPVVEALESGIPILLSDIEVHREVAKEGAEYVDLKNKEACARKIERVIKDDVYRESLREKAAKLKGEYSWEKAAEKTLEIYRALV